ncbi:MAG: hypothetical protein QNI84_08085 [Henriciella sp.]|nr:hypothetical protein [Henriciella sp.]
MRPSTARFAAKANHYGAGDPQLHETLPPMVWALIDADPWLRTPGRTIVEPACGPGAIVRELQRFGHRVIASDKFNYAKRWKGLRNGARTRWGLDFLSLRRRDVMTFVGVDDFAILTNPPYGTGRAGDPSLAADFVVHALSLAPRVYMLLPSKFMHGGSKCAHRDRLVDGPELTGVFPFRERATLHRDNFERRKQSGFFDYAWFRWERVPQPLVFRRLTMEGGGRACIFQA